jgi:uncharacterized membrane protein
VTLNRDGRPEAQRQVVLDREGHGEAIFEIRPSKVGRFAYEVVTPPLPDDAVLANNAAPVVVRVVRDRIRVLQVAGAPAWDVKFLRRFLKGDPSVDLVSFFILRTTDDIQGTDYREDELSLIQFPYQDLFGEQLDRFDLIIFQNFDQAAYLRPDERGPLLDNLRRFVEEEGKGFVMIGGERSFDRGGYAGTWVEDMLPVAMGLGEDSIDTSRFRASLTEEGRRHPITRLMPDMGENDLWWSRLSELDGVNRVLGSSAGSTVLLAHPVLTSQDGSPMPVLAVAEAGKGRAMALTVDTSWRWSFAEAASGRGNQAYLRFWKNAFRWLVKDPSTRRVTVDTPKENYGIGDTVRLVVRARDVGFAPLAGARVVATVDGPDGAQSLEGETGPEGEVALELPASARGAHRVDVRVLDQGQEIGQDQTVYAVTTRDPELDEVVPDPAFTRWLAASVQGEWRAPGDRTGPLLDPQSGRTVVDRKETELWRAPVLGLCILAFAGAAWIVRRRSGVR